MEKSLTNDTSYLEYIDTTSAQGMSREDIPKEYESSKKTSAISKPNKEKPKYINDKIIKDDEFKNVEKGETPKYINEKTIKPGGEFKKYEKETSSKIMKYEKQDIVDNIVKNITGQIIYAINDTMLVGRTDKVNMAISSEIDRKKIISEVKTFNEQNTIIENIRISPIMRAKLIDPTGINFKIVPISEEEQFLEDSDYTLWTWNVTPITKGNNKLLLSIDIIVKDKSKSIKVYDGTIYVYSDDTIFDKIIDFISNYWEFIVGTILIPLIIFLYDRFKNKK